MRSGDVCLVSPVRPKGMYDKQPILLIFPDEFNKVTQVPMVLPIISGGTSPGQTVLLYPLVVRYTHQGIGAL